MSNQIRKIFKLATSFILLTSSLPCIAGWQVSSPTAATAPTGPFFQTGRVVTVQKEEKAPNFLPSSYSSTAMPSQYATLGEPVPMYALSLSGSLKENLERIMGRYHWRVIWKAPFDFNFDGRITGSSLPNVVEKLLQPFPLQAVMYMSNRTLMVTSRNKV